MGVQESYRHTNYEAWQSEYDTRYPDTTLVKLYHHILKQHLPASMAPRALDYGCSSGTNAFFLNDMGMDAFGVDINKIAIGKAQKRAEPLGLASHFSTIANNVSASDVFYGGHFDLIISWNTLYYLNDPDLIVRLKSLHAQLKPNGLFVATLIATMTGGYSQTEPAENGLRKVAANDRARALNEKDHFVRFVADPAKVATTFALFQPLHIGYIDECLSLSRGENLFHYIFVGKRAA